MAAVAELEAGLIGERTNKALAAAKARGVKLGNPNGARALVGKQHRQHRSCRDDQAEGHTGALWTFMGSSKGLSNLLQRLVRIAATLGRARIQKRLEVLDGYPAWSRRLRDLFPLPLPLLPPGACAIERFHDLARPCERCVDHAGASAKDFLRNQTGWRRRCDDQRSRGALVIFIAAARQVARCGAPNSRQANSITFHHYVYRCPVWRDDSDVDSSPKRR
ncbi:hypothetical protein [Bradyrhizobium sp. STM 3562]|uniref:hypothetical protein n=1 Tax=Bradyrhizobium sp. STM 3562 TaxID=578924 RepID=UPI00388D823D